MVSLRDAFNPVYRFNRLKRRLNIKYPGVLFNLAPTLKQDDARIANEIREMFVNLTQGEDIQSTTDQNWRGSSFQRERLVWMANWSANHFAGDIVEIGCRLGLTTILLAEVARRHQRRVIVVDPWEEGVFDNVTDKESSAAYPEFLKNTSEFSDIIDVVKMSSLEGEAKEKLRKRELSFSFVDGLHTYEACLCDILAVGHTKGVIAVDDIGTLSFRDADNYNEIVDLCEKLGPARHDENLRISFLRGAYLINRITFHHPWCREGYILPLSI